MDFKVLITDSAVADLREIVAFGAHDDPVAALRLGEKLIARALRLADKVGRRMRRGFRYEIAIAEFSREPASE